MQKLKEMIQSHLRATDMNVSKFADSIGIGHQTIGRILNEDEPAIPRLETLYALAQGMNVTVFAVVAAALDVELPNSVNRTALTDEIEKLPHEQQQIFINLIRSIVNNQDK